MVSRIRLNIFNTTQLEYRKNWQNSSKAFLATVKAMVTYYLEETNILYRRNIVRLVSKLEKIPRYKNNSVNSV